MAGVNFDLTGSNDDIKAALAGTVDAMLKADKAAKKLDQSIDEVFKDQKNVANFRKQLEKANKSGEKLNNTAKQLAKALRNLDDQQSIRVSKAMDRVREKTAAAEEETARLAEVDMKALTTGALAVAAAVTVAATALFELVQSASEYGDELNRLSGQTGLAVETIAGLDFAAQAGGSSLQEMAEGFTALTGRVKEARKGSAEALAVFARFGVELNDLEGNARSMDDIMRDVIDTIAETEGTSAKTEAAISLMNESAGKSVKVFKDGSSVIDEWAEKAAEAAEAADNEDLEKFNVAMAELNLAVKVASVGLAEEFAPAVNDAIAITAAMVGPVLTLREGLRSVQGVFNTLNPLVLAYRFAMGEALIPTRDASEELSKLNDELAKNAEAWNELNASVGGDFVEANETAVQSAQATVDMLRGFQEAGEKLSEADERRLRQALNRVEVLSQAEQKVAKAKSQTADKAATEAQKAADDAQKAADAEAKLIQKRLQLQIDLVNELAAGEETTRLSRLRTLKGLAANAQVELAVRTTAMEAIILLEQEGNAKLNELNEEFRKLRAEEREEDAELLEKRKEQDAQDVTDEEAKQLALRDARRQTFDDSVALLSQLADAAQAVNTLIADSDRAVIEQKLANDIAEIQSSNRTTQDKKKLIREAKKASIDATDEVSKKQHEAAVTAFNVQKALAIVQVIISTAAGIARSFSDLGPIAGIPAAAAVGVVGTVQTAVIAASQPPPKQFDGFRIGGQSLGPDQALATIEKNEGVLTGRAMGTPGVAEFADAANRGKVPTLNRQQATRSASQLLMELMNDDEMMAFNLRGTTPGTGEVFV